MAYRRARALDQFVEQVNAAYPLRDRASDGWIGDAAHRNRVSDHNPNRAGVVTAQDIDDDIAPGVDSWQLANELLASGDPRIKYVISHGRISNPDRRRWADPRTRWVTYTGANAHRSHVHLSVTAAGADDTARWLLPMLGGPSKKPSTSPREEEHMITVIVPARGIPAGAPAYPVAVGNGKLWGVQNVADWTAGGARVAKVSYPDWVAIVQAHGNPLNVDLVGDGVGRA